jgi:cobalt/nickel transport system ATP-binding protein
LLQIQQLQFGYQPQVPILRGIDLTIPTGQKVGLVGPNGAGKTSLFFLITGLCRPQAGQIQVGDRVVRSGQFLPEVGLVFQNPDDQLFCASVWDDVAFGVENLGYSPPAIREAVEQALQLTGIPHLAPRPPQQLSGGEKTMAAIASVLVMNPQLVLYDEPTAHLDLAARRRLIRFLQQTPQTCMISTHDLDVVLEVCDRVILLSQGVIIADGLPVEVLKNADLLAAHHLEVPPLLRSLPREVY